MKMQRVIVCSNNAVHCGDTADPLQLYELAGQVCIRLHNARQAYHWRNQGGHSGLAETGPQSRSRISAATPDWQELIGVVTVIRCSEAGAAAWDAYPVTTE